VFGWSGGSITVIGSKEDMSDVSVEMLFDFFLRMITYHKQGIHSVCRGVFYFLTQKEIRGFMS
jgi:hypothetical protein